MGPKDDGPLAPPHMQKDEDQLLALDCQIRRLRKESEHTHNDKRSVTTLEGAALYTPQCSMSERTLQGDLHLEVFDI